MSKEFRLTADIKFFAEDIEEALKKIGEHFLNCEDFDADTELQFIGEINCEPVKENITTSTERNA